MVSKEQIADGIARYIKAELFPVLPDYAKVLGGAVLLHNAQRITEAVTSLSNSSALKTLGLMSDSGQVDIDLWTAELKSSLNEYSGGRLSVNIPFLQPIIFNEQDIDTLKRYIKGELR